MTDTGSSTTVTAAPLSPDAQAVLDEAIAVLKYCDGYYAEDQKVLVGSVLLECAVRELADKLDDSVTLEGFLSVMLASTRALAEKDGPAYTQLASLVGTELAEFIFGMLKKAIEQLSGLVADIPGFLESSGMSESDVLMGGQIKFPPALRKMYFSGGLTYRMIFGQCPSALIPEVSA